MQKTAIFRFLGPFLIDFQFNFDRFWMPFYWSPDNAHKRWGSHSAIPSGPVLRLSWALLRPLRGFVESWAFFRPLRGLVGTILTLFGIQMHQNLDIFIPKLVRESTD